MNMNSKGQGLSMSTIVLAAIALLILVILSVLVIRSGVIFGTELECESVPNAYCADSGDACDSGYARQRSREGDTSGCPAEDDICCVPVTTS